MEVLFIVENAAYRLVYDVLKRNIKGIELGISIHVRCMDCVYLYATVNNDEIKNYILDKHFHIKGVRDIYIKY